MLCEFDVYIVKKMSCTFIITEFFGLGFRFYDTIWLLHVGCVTFLEKVTTLNKDLWFVACIDFYLIQKSVSFKRATEKQQCVLCNTYILGKNWN